jgi:hypothetical protein
MYLSVGVIHPYRFAFFFLATFFGAFFFPTALRPADDLVFFADLFDDFSAVFLAVFFAFAAFATVFRRFLDRPWKPPGDRLLRLLC